MSVFRVHKNKDFTVMSNYHLRDKTLSLKAKGLLSIILSLPDSWVHSISGYVSLSADGERSVTSALKELTERGYVIVAKLPPEKGNPKIHYEYNIYEEPQVSQEVRNVGLQQEGLQNVGVLNTYYKDSREGELLLKDNLQVDSSSKFDFHVSSEFTPPTVEEVRTFCATNMLDKVDPEIFVAYYGAVSWKRGETRITNWHELAKMWHARGRNRDASNYLKRRKSKSEDYSDLAEGWRVLDGSD